MSDESKPPFKDSLTPGKLWKLLGIVGVLVAAGWGAHSYIVSQAMALTDHFDAKFESITKIANEHTAILEVHTVTLGALRKHGWTSTDMLRWGIDLEHGNPNVQNGAGQRSGLYVPTVAIPQN